MDAIVVGGGIGGLLAANHLADDGWHVTLVERQAELGGRARSHVEAGFTLNQGPHALFTGGHLARTLDALGVAVTGATPAIGRGVVTLGGEPFPIPAGLVGLLRSRLVSPRAKGQLARLLAGLGRRADTGLAGTTAAEWIDGSVSDPRASALVRGLVRLSSYTGTLSELSADAARSQLALSARQGVRYVDGGWSTIVDGLERRARACGVQVEHRHVDGVSRDSGRWTAACDGRELVGDIVVVAVSGPARANALTGGTLNTATTPSHVGAIDLGLACGPPRRTFALGLDTPDYASVHSPPAKLAREGVLISAMRYLDGGAEGSDARSRLEALVDVVHPGWREHVVLNRYLPRVSITTAIPTAASGGLAGRARVEAPGQPGLYLVGDWVGDEGMLADASAASAAEAARLARARR